MGAINQVLDSSNYFDYEIAAVMISLVLAHGY
jgi:hypothetical protein